MIYGAEQALIEERRVKRLALKWLGATHLGERSRNHYLVRALREITLPRAVRALNAGCASGAHSFYLARRFPEWKIIGVEIDPRRTQRAQSIAQKTGTPNVDFINGDLNDLSFANFFDLIFSMHVLTFVRDDLALLQRFCRALKQGGYLILSTPTPPGPSRIPWLRRAEPSHLDERIGYTNEEIGRKIKKAGLRLIALSNPAGLLGQIAWEISSALDGKKSIRALIQPFLIPLIDLDPLLKSRISFFRGSDCLVIAQK